MGAEAQRSLFDYRGRVARTGGNPRDARIKWATRSALIDACRAVITGDPDAAELAQLALDRVDADAAAAVRELPGFAGELYDPALDDNRLRVQIGRVFEAMRDGGWRTLAELEGLTGDPQTSISAQLRHLRKPRFGAYLVDVRTRAGAGLYEYRLRSPKGDVLA